MTTAVKRRVLLIDDDVVLLRTASALWGQFYDVRTAHNGELALDALDAEPFDLIVSDWKMPGSIDGVELLAAFDERHPDIPVIVITGERDADLARLAVPYADGFSLRAAAELRAARTHCRLARFHAFLASGDLVAKHLVEHWLGCSTIEDQGRGANREA